jgi:hypothetical protein
MHCEAVTSVVVVVVVVDDDVESPYLEETELEGDLEEVKMMIDSQISQHDDYDCDCGPVHLDWDKSD